MANTPFHTPDVTRKQWETQRKLLTNLYQAHGPDEFTYSLEQLRKDYPDTVNPDKAILDFEKAGVLERRVDRRSRPIAAHWKLPANLNDGNVVERLTRYQESEEARRIARNVAERDSGQRAVRAPHRKKPSYKVDKSIEVPAFIRKEERPAVTENEAIVGPEPTNAFAALAPLRKSEAAALVEAARQYANRDHTVNTQLDQMEAAMKAIGVTFDRATVQGAVTIERDERLESVALVLPYITEIENRFERVTTELTQARAKLTEMPDMKQNLLRQKVQIERLIAERDAFRRRD